MLGLSGLSNLNASFRLLGCSCRGRVEKGHRLPDRSTLCLSNHYCSHFIKKQKVPSASCDFLVSVNLGVGELAQSSSSSPSFYFPLPSGDTGSHLTNSQADKSQTRHCYWKWAKPTVSFLSAFPNSQMIHIIVTKHYIY